MSNGRISQQLDVFVEQCNQDAGLRYTLPPTREAAQVYLQQWGIFTRHSRRCWAWVVGNCPEVEVRRFITRENLYEEEGEVATSHYEKLVRLGLKVGLQRAAIDDAEPEPSTALALLVWECLTKNRSWLEGLAAKAVLERGGFPDLRRIQAQNWQTCLGLTEQDVDFFGMHITADQIHGSGAYELLERFTRPEDEGAVLAAGQRSMQAMALFSNGIVAAMQARGATVAAKP
jgi:pyrroloquinoline quinone (PQQ) biosynthesis protein C